MQSFVLLRPSDALGNFQGMCGKIPVKIITAEGCKKNKPIIIAGNGHVQQMTALPGHQNSAKRNVYAAE